jgi:hypothetical protein
MSRVYGNVREWIADCRKSMEADDDNLILFIGEPGRGKSTLQFQVLSAIDPSFDVRRVAFTIPDFIKLSKRAPKRVAIAGDEIRASGRKAMYGDNIALNDRLEECRAKNHSMGLCYPYEDRLDRAILDERVRFKAEIPERGHFILTERQVIKRHMHGGAVKRRVVWVERGRFRFGENVGPKWREYLQAKDDRTNMMAQDDTAPEPEIVKPSSSSEDWAGLRAYWQSAAQNADRSPSGPSI